MANARVGFTLLAAAALLSVQPPVVRGQVGEAPAFTVYRMRDGLSHGSVLALMQDRTGFVWIGTQDGLNRFDGRGFRVFRHEPEETTSLSDDFIRALLESSDGRLWVGTETGGLNLLDPLTGRVRRFEMFDLGPLLTNVGPDTERETEGRAITDIAALAPGALVLNSDLGLIRFDIQPETYELLLRPGDTGSPRSVCAGPRGVLVGFSNGLVRGLSPSGEWTPWAVLPDTVSKLRCSEEGVFAATPGRVFALNPQTGEMVRSLAVDDEHGLPLGIIDLLTLPDGSTWVASRTGVHVADPAGGVRSIGLGALSNPRAQTLLLDKTGVLWIGTWNGLASVHPLSLTMRRILSESRGGSELDGVGVVAIQRAPAGGILLGSFSGGVQHLETTEGAEVLRLTRPTGLARWSESIVFDITPGADGGFWVAAMQDGILHVGKDGDVSEVAVFSGGRPVPGVQTYSVFVDSRGMVWAGTRELGLVRLDPTERVFKPATGPNWDLGSNYVWPILEDQRGNLWVGAFGYGLSVIDVERGVIGRFEPGAGGLSDPRILTLFEDSRGIIWVGTEGGGLNRVDPATGDVTVFTTRDGLPHDNVEGITEDDFGLLWVSTNDGLARLDTESGDIRVFKEASGLAGNRFYANSVFKDADGKLYFGGEDGLTIIDPNGLGADRHAPPPVALTAFRIQGQNAPIARALGPAGLDLAPDENFFAFEFAALDFTDPEQNLYRYQLVGLDDDWVDAGRLPVANYTSVPAARYEFRVAAMNSEGVWNDQGIAIPVRVRPWFYETWWFQLSAIAAAITGIFGVHSSKLRQERSKQDVLLEEQRKRQEIRLEEERKRRELLLEEERKRQELRLGIAGPLHNSVNANLSAIGQLADLAGRPSTDPETSNDLLEKIAKLARDSSDEVRETVWVVNTRYDTLPQLIAQMVDTADSILVGKVTHEIAPHGDIPDLPLDVECRRDVFLLYKEALQNAVKHAPESHVDIDLGMGDSRLSLRVADNGPGYDPETVKKGSGTDLMEHHAEKQGGRLTVTSAPGEGTIIELEVELKRPAISGDPP